MPALRWIITVALISLMALTFAACGSSSDARWLSGEESGGVESHSAPVPAESPAHASPAGPAGASQPRQDQRSSHSSQPRAESAPAPTAVPQAASAPVYATQQPGPTGATGQASVATPAAPPALEAGRTARRGPGSGGAVPQSGGAEAAGVAVPVHPSATAIAPVPLPYHPEVQDRPVQPGATTFKDYQRSLFVATLDDRISTFSLDTDRTSYQLALNWAKSGFQVDPDSVRAEEWTNAFDYGYQRPARHDSFAITTDVFRHPLEGGKHLARIAFQAPELWDDERPLNVTLVLDASGSMKEGNRVAIAREAAESIRKSLRSRDRIAVVHFTDHVIDDLTVEHRNPDDRAVKRSISKLQPHGSTNVQAGLDLGVRLADRAGRERPESFHYIILMSDGVANVDATDPFAILESAGDSTRQNPLRLVTVGVGIHNYNDYLLEQLAQHGNGWYRYLDDTDQARKTFSRENWLALAIPFADQTRAQVTWNPDVVESWRIIGYENRITSDHLFTQNRKEFAEIPSGAATTVFYEIDLVDNVAYRGWNNLDLGNLELRWVTPATSQSMQQHAAIVGRGAREFNSLGDSLLQLGALVALSSDRYSSLTHVSDQDYPSVRGQLSALADHLRPLKSQLGNRDAYRDFAFLLDHIVQEAPAQKVNPGSSGYSR